MIHYSATQMAELAIQAVRQFKTLGEMYYSELPHNAAHSRDQLCDATLAWLRVAFVDKPLPLRPGEQTIQARLDLLEKQVAYLSERKTSGITNSYAGIDDRSQQ